MPPQGELLRREISELSDVDIVDEYNGPQIVFATLDAERLFGVAADEDQTSERWVFAPVGAMEERALRAGVASPREALRKDNAQVFDFRRDGSGFQVCLIDGERLSDDELPTAKARLEAENLLIAPKTDTIQLTLDREVGTPRGLPLDAVADVLRDFQRYANAVGAFMDEGLVRLHGRLSDELLGKTALGLQTASAGSLALQPIPSDAALSHEIIVRLAETIAAGDDSEGLALLLPRSGPRALRRYEDLLLTLERHQLQLLAQNGGVSTFVGWRSAGRFSRAMPASVKEQAEPMIARGYFSGFARDKKEFAFVDTERDAILTGAIGPAVLAANAPAIVHESTRYLIELEQTLVTTRDAKKLQRYVLSRIIETVPTRERIPPKLRP
jgi:hypothetical protein